MNGTDNNNLTKYVFVLYSFHTQNNQHKPTYFQFFFHFNHSLEIQKITSMRICLTTTMLNPDIQVQQE